MTLSRAVLPALLLVLPVVSANAASFDCAKASTPFEHAICDMPELSAADELLAKSFATATGGLTKEAVVQMRGDQRGWLDYARRACTDDAQPMTSGRYDEDGGACLVEKFTNRSRALEQSRMIGGHRFFIKSLYAALPDPEEAGNPDSHWKVANHELIMPQLDANDPLAAAFNDYVRGEAAGLSETMALYDNGNPADLDPSSDTSLTISVKELGGTARITLAVDSNWYGHGAAHGNWGLTYLHYLTEEDRSLIDFDIFTSDVFGGEYWTDTLVSAAWAELQAEHKEWLQVESPEDIVQIVIDPARWDLSSDYGLIIQFQPYEVAAYAYGAPTITIAWDKLEEIKAKTQDQMRYGF